MNGIQEVVGSTPASSTKTLEEKGDIMEQYSGWIILSGIILLILVAGIYDGYKHRNDGKFQITIEDEKYILWYGYDGEWIRDSEHNSVEEAVAKVEHYILAKANRPIMPTRPI